MRRKKAGSLLRSACGLALTAAMAFAAPLSAQSPAPGKAKPPFQGETTDDYNRRLAQIRHLLAEQSSGGLAEEYRIGAEDLLDVSVFEAPEMNRSVRVSAGGEISLPPLGAVQVAGLTPRELESFLEEILRRLLMKDPHVSVFVRELQSHRVSIFGAVKRPGVFPIRGTKTLVEVLSMAEGLAEDAGDTIIVMRGGRVAGSLPASGAGAANAYLRPPDSAGATSSRPPTDGANPEGRVEVGLKLLLESSDPRYDVPIYPGDIVKVARAGVVYVVGEVRKPGGFVLKSNENISVLQALALAEGLTRTSAKGHARIIRTDEETGERHETRVDLGKILAGKAPDPILQPKDIVFVPNSTARSAWTRGLEVTLQTVSGIVVFRR